jgi:hypothetical protein
MSRALDRLAATHPDGVAPGSPRGPLPLWVYGLFALPGHLLSRLGTRARIGVVVFGSIVRDFVCVMNLHIC